MARKLAYCGIICSDCEAFLATQSGVQQALEEVAVKWQQEYNHPGITAEWVACDGCINGNGAQCGHCTECEIRFCGMANGVENCAHCEQYACEKLTKFFEFVPEAQINLDAIHLELRRN